MHDRTYGLLFYAAAAVLVTADMMRGLKTGRVRGRFNTITRKGQPAKFQRYIYSSIFALVLIVVLFVWTALSNGP